MVDKIASFKDLGIKNNTQDCSDNEVAKAIKLREKRLKQFKPTKLHIDEDLYKEAKYHTLKSIKQKKNQFYKEKLKENIGKPKELWKALKSLGLPSKKVQPRTYVSKKMTKYVLMIKQMQMLLRISFAI